MKRLHLAAAAVLIGCLGFALAAPAASAADAITVDEQPNPGVVVTGGTRAKFTGTTAGGKGLFAFVDGRLLTCEDYYGNELNPEGNACWQIASVDGETWEFSISRSNLERLDIPFLGPHEVRFVQVTTSGSVRSISAEATINIEFVDEFVVPSPTPTQDAAPPVPAEPPTSVATRSQLGTGDPAATSVLSALPTASTIVTSPPNILVAAAVTIVLLLLVGLPSTLLGSTLSDNYERLFGRATAVARRVTAPLRSTLTAPTVPSWLPLALGIAIASILTGFVDPGFGLNWGSARMLLSMAIAFTIETLLGWVVIRAVLRRTDPDLDPKAEFKWGSLLIILVAVILSRLVGFEPGMVFGLVMGLAFGVTLATAREVRIKLIGISWALAIGLVGWLGFSALAGLSGWFVVLLAETLSGVAVGSLAALPVALLPLRGLDGEALFTWNRGAWAGLYALGLLLFFVVLMPMPFSWGEVGAPLVTWIALYLGYAALAVGVWAWFRYRTPPTTPTATPARTATTVADAA
ncbi:MAG: hypothetical protein KF680_04790 [Cryobacterium sp.]|nr:hypothetical protein [Cryobacterium sp.]